MNSLEKPVHKKRHSRSRGRKYRHFNKAVIAATVFLALLIFFAVCIQLLFKMTYGKLNNIPLSARTTYKDDTVTLDDEKYIENNVDNNILGKTHTDSRVLPELIWEGDGVVSLKDNGFDAYITYVYTGDEKYIYKSNAQWNELMEIASRFRGINPVDGWTREHDGSIKLTQDGWYNVFAIWFENGEKMHVVENFKGTGVQDGENNGVSRVDSSENRLQHQLEAYNRWKENKNKTAKIPGVYNILMVGADYWEKEAQSQCDSDLMILVTFNTNSKTIYFTTLLKEAYVYIPTVGCGRATNAYTYGGTELVIQTLEENYGVHIDRYVLFDYENYIGAVNAVGGIDVEIKKEQVEYINEYIDDLAVRMNIPDVVRTEHLKKQSKTMHLNGAQSLAYIRYYQDGDFSRSERYFNSLRGFASSAKESGVYDIVTKVFPRITTDLEFDEYIKLIEGFPTYSQYEMEFNTLPSISRKASFEDFGGYTVLLNTSEEIDSVMNKTQSRTERIKFFAPNYIKISIFAYKLLVGLNVLFILYLVFVKHRSVIYVNIFDNTQVKAKKKYRWNTVVYPYHQDVIDGYVNGMYADRDCNLEFRHKIKMPMHKLVIYVNITPNGTDNQENHLKTFVVENEKVAVAAGEVTVGAETHTQGIAEQPDEFQTEIQQEDNQIIGQKLEKQALQESDVERPTELEAVEDK